MKVGLLVRRVLRLGFRGPDLRCFAQLLLLVAPVLGLQVLIGILVWAIFVRQFLVFVLQSYLTCLRLIVPFVFLGMILRDELSLDLRNRSGQIVSKGILRLFLLIFVDGILPFVVFW